MFIKKRDVVLQNRFTRECLEIELEYQEIPFEAQRKLKLAYRGRELKQTFKAGFICYKKIVVEIKAVANLVDQHRAQLLNYLNATEMKLGLLVNFGHYPKLEYERLVLTYEEQDKIKNI